MTALEKLLKEVLENLGYDEICNNHSEFLERINDQVRTFKDEYSVTFRNNDSTADNVESKQSINQDQMMLQIEDIALSLIQLHSDHSLNSEDFRDFQLGLKDCFAMHFKADSKPVNASSEQSINQEQIGLAIRGLLYRTLGDKVDPFELKVFKQLSDDIIDIVKTYRTVPNSDQNNSDGK